MPNHINLNDLLAGLPSRTSTTTPELELSAGEELKIEGSPDGDEMNLGTVPTGKKWITHFVVYVEEVDA